MDENASSGGRDGPVPASSTCGEVGVRCCRMPGDKPKRKRIVRIPGIMKRTLFSTRIPSRSPARIRYCTLTPQQSSRGRSPEAAQPVRSGRDKKPSHVAKMTASYFPFLKYFKNYPHFLSDEKCPLSNGDGSKPLFPLPPPGHTPDGFRLPRKEKTASLSKTVFRPVGLRSPSRSTLLPPVGSGPCGQTPSLFRGEPFFPDILETIFGQHSLKSTPFGVLIKNIVTI